MDDARALIVRKAAEMGKGLSWLSDQLGRNHAYIYQFVKQGKPRRLPELERKKLAKILQVSERSLGAPDDSDFPPHLESTDVLPKDKEPSDDNVPFDLPKTGLVLELEAHGGMGGGGSPRSVELGGAQRDAVKPDGWYFPAEFLRQEVRTTAANLIVVETRGDSMSPTIGSGERVLVDTSHKLPTPDGIYALRDVFGEIIVKRLQVLRSMRPPRIKIISDNPHHAEEELDIEQIEGNIVGRVVCALRRL